MPRGASAGLTRDPRAVLRHQIIPGTQHTRTRGGQPPPPLPPFDLTFFDFQTGTVLDLRCVHLHLHFSPIRHSIYCKIQFIP
jgi:hypothetical protein